MKRTLSHWFVSILASSLCSLFCVNAHAGYVTVGATVTHVSSTNANTQSFVVQVVGGTGPCTNGSGFEVVFPLTAAPDADTHKRAYAAALLALALGMHVSIYNYTDNNCLGASYIDVYM